MTCTRRSLRLFVLLAAVAVIPACGGGGGSGGPGPGTPGGVINVSVLNGTGTAILAFSTANPAALTAPVAITGLTVGDVLVAIERRPMNGMLYALGHNSGAGTVQLYHLSSVTGQATAVGPSGTFVGADGTTPVPIGGTQFNIDYGPVTDRLRVVNSAGQNWRMNPNNGAFIDADGGIPGLNMDGAINGLYTSVEGAAYTNNSINAAFTTLYSISQVTDTLYIQNPPIGGTLTSPLPLSSPVDFVRGLDIPAGVDVTVGNGPAVGTAFVIVRLAGAATDSFAQIGLSTGAFAGVTSLGGAFLGPAFQDTAAVPMIALTADGTQLVRFATTTPGTTAAVAVSGLTAGDVLVGIDWRPQTGELIGFAVNDAANTGTLYRLDPQTAVATIIGTPGSVAFVNAVGATIDLPAASQGYGVDFNPTVDRLRVVTNTGLNFRVNPNNGAPVDGDVAAGVQPDGSINGLTGGSTGLSAVAYTNNYGQSLTGGVTTEYAVDPTANALHIINPPNNGTAAVPVAITTTGGAPLDFTAVGGLDMTPDVRVVTSNAAATGTAYAALVVGGVSRLYQIDLATGVATDLGMIGAGAPLSGLAVGHATVQ